MILNDQQIAELCDTGKESCMIRPFISEQVKDLLGRPQISYGLSSFGYDIRLGWDFLLPTPLNDSEFMDPKDAQNFRWKPVAATPGDPTILPGGHFLLAESLETFVMPPDVIGTVLGKSTYARCGLIVNVTPLEPGWEGILTLELHNATHHNILLYPGEGIAQIIFHRGEKPHITYADRDGKYQSQEGVTLPRA